MYYILNGTNQIIAIDENLLKLCGLSHINELTLKIALDDIHFLISENMLTISINKVDKQFSVSKEHLSSMLGELTLVHVIVENLKEQEDTTANTLNILRQRHREEVEARKALDKENEDLFSLLLEEPVEDDDISDEDEETISMESIIDEIKEESHDALELDLVEEPIQKEEPKEEPKETPKIEEVIDDSGELEFDLDLLDEVEPIKVEEPKVEIKEPIVEETPKIEEVIDDSGELEFDLGLLDEVEPIKVEEPKVEIKEPIVEETPKIEEVIDDSGELEFDLGLLDEVEPIKVEEPKVEIKEPIVEETPKIEEVIDDSEELEFDLGLLDEVEPIKVEEPKVEIKEPIVEETPKIEEVIDDSEELEFDLGLLDEVEPIKAEEPKVESKESIQVDEIVEDDIPQEIEINIDIEKTSSAIGVSIEDYNTFLNEYIDNALDLEDDIKGDDEAKHKSAIETISHLSEVLHIPMIGDILDKIEPTPSDKQRGYIALFYDALSKITTFEGTSEQAIEDTPQKEEIVHIEEPKVEPKKVEPKVEAPQIDIEDDDLFNDLLFDETPIEEKKEEDIAPIEEIPHDEIIDLFATPVEEKVEEITPIADVPDDEIMDLFDTPVEEKKEEIAPIADVPDDEIMDLFDTPVERKEEPEIEIPVEAPVKIEEVVVEEVVPEVIPEPIAEPIAEPSKKGFGTIDLSTVKPIHFDFQLEEAANDLSLPVELIEEFVNDFIDQAREETEKMLKCYEEGDLDAIQKIGHLLKGTSSNLRIKPLADTLYKIQFCEDSNHLEHFIKDYWGHFLSFEIQIHAISH